MKKTKKLTDTDKMYADYATGGLVTKNAMSDYFLASAGKMTEVEFVGKHKMSTLEFEKQFAEDNSVDITGTEKLSEVATGPKGMKMDYSKKPKTMAEGGVVGVDPVSGNDIPIGSTPENVRDDVPAMLSEGEYVIPADVLKYFGVNFFEKLRTKAKQGMMEMEAEGRTGEEPMPAPMAAPVEEMPPQEEVPMMAEGGLVDTPSFDPLAWTTPGFGGLNQSAAGQPTAPTVNEYRQYYGPNGLSQMILFVDGVPATPIPEGYTLTEPEAVTTGDRNDRDPFPVSNTGSGPDVGGLFGNPLGELDFTDTDAVDTWAEGKLERSALQRGLGMAGIGGALGSTALELRHIAEVSAAAQYYASIDDVESSTRLMGMADAARENYGVIGSWSEKFSDGDRIFDNYVESLAGRPAASTRATGTNRAAPFTNSQGADTYSQSSRVFDVRAGRDNDSQPSRGDTVQFDKGRGGEARNNAAAERAGVTENAPTTSSRPQGRSQDDEDKGRGGYTGLKDMFDGGGPGQSGDKNGRNKGGLVTRPTPKPKPKAKAPAKKTK